MIAMRCKVLPILHRELLVQAAAGPPSRSGAVAGRVVDATTWKPQRTARTPIEGSCSPHRSPRCEAHASSGAGVAMLHQQAWVAPAPAPALPRSSAGRASHPARSGWPSARRSPGASRAPTSEAAAAVPAQSRTPDLLQALPSALPSADTPRCCRSHAATVRPGSSLPAGRAGTLRRLLPARIHSPIHRSTSAPRLLNRGKLLVHGFLLRQTVACLCPQ